MTELEHDHQQLDVPVDLIDAPSWVGRFVDHDTAPWSVLSDNLVMRSVDSGRFALVSMVVPGASLLSAQAFVAAVDDVYESLRVHLDDLACPCPIRMWNYVPGILDPLGGVMSRYHLFNQARHDVYCRWYGSPEGFRKHVVTATCTGHSGDDYIFHCLTAPSAGRPVENPRQLASYRYSKRYGPKPPCFARATSLPVRDDGTCQVMVGGTASVRGEDSRYRKDISRQLDETLDNMTSILAASCVSDSDHAPASLHAYSDIRVYYKHSFDRIEIESVVSRNFRSDVAVEWVHAPICRDELLVEIEGLAVVPE